MKLFLQDDTSVKVDHILVQLKKLMDGDVSHQMKQKGLEYKKNYGTSILWLRKIAKNYIADNDLADRLWYREIRETMILATMIAEPDEFLINKMEEWVQFLDQNEIAEQLGANLICRIPNLDQSALLWLSSDNEWKQAAMWVGLATYVKQVGMVDVNMVISCIQLLKQNSSLPSGFMMRVQGRFLRQLCRKSNELLALVEDLVDYFRTREKYAWLVEDVQTEIDFLNTRGNVF